MASVFEYCAHVTRLAAAINCVTPVETIGRYRIQRPLGQGGMGVVFAAFDPDNERHVAVKVISASNSDPRARDRLRREARALSGIDHPNVCRLFEIGDENGEPYIVMELLEGEPLSARLLRSAFTVEEAVGLSLQILDALQALHERGIIHRDLKPSNIFVTPDGVKLLDFGLARQTATNADDITSEILTRHGAVLGTPYYMSPEQIRGHSLGPRSDIFAAGVILFETLTARTPFGGDDLLSTLHAIAYDPAPSLGGSGAVEEIDRIIQRALAKRPEDRYASAEAMAAELRRAVCGSPSGAAVVQRAITRLAVLPFRLLRDDPEFGFLARSLAEAIAASLTRLESIVVRSLQAAIRFSGEPLALQAMASELDIDGVITGTLLRDGNQLRYQTELIELPSGAVRWSQRSQITMRDVFQVEDEVTHRVIDALSLPLTEREHRMLRRDVPANPRAYEFYLRGLQQGHTPQEWEIARDLYLRAVEDDPRFAPAWARLARAQFLISKYATGATDLGAAEASVRQALTLDPDLAAAQHVYAQIELETGRSREALVRLARATARQVTNADLFAALVHAARYCGLIEESIAAHGKARELDPKIVTSVALSHFMRGDYAAAVKSVERDIGYIDALSLFMLGRRDEALSRLRQREQIATARPFGLWVSHLRAAVEGERDEAVAKTRELLSLTRDPEARYFLIRLLIRLGDSNDWAEQLERVVDGGFHCLPVLAGDPWLDPLRDEPRFLEILERARQLRDESRAQFIPREPQG